MLLPVRQRSSKARPSRALSSFVAMGALFQKFGVEHLPQDESRARLVERAFAGGIISERGL
jgi:hypothetical protein